MVSGWGPPLSGDRSLARYLKTPQGSPGWLCWGGEGGATLELRVLSSSPTLGTEITFKNKNKIEYV